MEFRPNRRRFIRAAGRVTVATLGCTGSAGILRMAMAQSAAARPTATRLTENLLQITGAGGNVVLAIDGDAIAAVDSGTQDATSHLMELIGERTSGQPVDVLLNTHWHLAHTGGNEAMRNAGAAIFAHENTRLWMSTQFYVHWEDRTYLPRAPAALPTHTFFSSDPQPLSLDVGRHRIEYAHLENAHTDGDIFAFFPNDNVLVTGGAVAVGRYPIIDFSTGGWIDGLIDATAKLMEIADSETLIVPGAGPVQKRSHLQAQHEMVSAIRERVAERMRKGMSADEMMAEGITDDFDAVWGEGRLGGLFVSNIYADLAWRGPGGAL
jgi:cyclase